MFLRHQLPAHSPLSSRALLAGLAGALGKDARGALAQRIHDHWRARELVFTGSGTDALSLVLRAAFAQRTPLVALPAYGCYDLATAALAAHARVVLYDLDPETLAPVAASLQSALEQRPGALVLVHLYGVPVDVPSIARVAAASGALVIEDAAQAMGASLGGAPAGSLGSVAILSFGRGKGLTGGAGGAVLSNDARGDAIIARIRKVVNQPSAGWSQLIRAAAQWLLARPDLYALPAALPFLRLGETVYQPPHEPSAMARSSLSMVNTVWPAAFDAAAARQRNAERLIAAARSSQAWRCIALEGDKSPGYLRLPLRATECPRKQLLTAAVRRLGIIQGYPLPLLELPGFAAFCLDAQRAFPGARTLAESLITLPTHALLSDRDLAALEAWLAGPRAGHAHIPQAHARPFV